MRPTKSPTPRTLELLLIEDSENDATLIIRKIKNGGFEVNYRRVETEKDLAIALTQGPWDLVISDFTLPDFNALVALPLVKQKNPYLPFIIVSGSIGEEIAIEALRAGADDYILKNNMARLASSITRELRDASDRKRQADTEETLRNKEEELRQSQKLDALGQLAGGIAHDFNNILATIMLQTEMINLNLDSPQSPVEEKIKLAKVGIEQIIKGGEKATRLTKQLLSFSRKQVLQPQVINLNTLINDMNEILSRTIQENIQLELALQADLHNVNMDRSSLEQIILNLAVNARDAMPQGGKLFMGTKNVKLEAEEASLSLLSPGEYIHLIVRDNGTGMTPEVQRRIYEPFFTTKAFGKGTGLGLSTVYGIVKQNNGHISVQSAPNQGSSFEILLPFTEQAVVVTIAHKTKRDAQKGNETILIVEDETELREILQDSLKKYGYKILAAPNGLEGLNLFNQHKNEIDLIISDVVMPKMSGSDMIHKIHDIKPETKVLFLSGYTEDILLQQGINRGKIHFIEKPYTLTNLLGKLRSIIGEKQDEKDASDS